MIVRCGMRDHILYIVMIADLALVFRPASAQEAQARILPTLPLAHITRGATTAPSSQRLQSFSKAVPLQFPGALSGEARLDLNILYTESPIFNPATGRDDMVKLRSYRDAHAPRPPPVPFVAPTIEIQPGETVRVTLHNQLPSDDPSCQGMHMPDIPHCFNHTNLHSHGIWTSPAGNGDNVLIDISPGVSFEYEYNVPIDHPSGTFWYHPHLHGSTALQVSSGMAGALIVRGNRLPTPQSNGDVDILLRQPSGAAMPERILLLQQIQYACNGGYDCKPGDVGGIENYDQFGPGTWPASGRYTTVNGEVLPTIPGARVGQFERWRLIHAGVRDTIKLQLRKQRSSAPLLAHATSQQQDAWVAQNCSGAPLPQFAIAADGLTRAQIDQRSVTVLQPGYREDLLIVFPEAGAYCVIDDAAPANASVNAEVKSRKLLGVVNVGAGQPIGPDLPAALLAQLTAAAARSLPRDMRQPVQAALADHLKLTAFVPHKTVADQEITGKQELEFKVDTSDPNKPRFLIDNHPYDPNRIDRVLPLGAAEEWTLTSWTDPPAGHPFHIHVNPFQVVRILDPKGVDVSETGEADDPQYAHIKGVWKDTLFVKPGYHVVVRTRYERYIGEFVLHCHILDHEDQGMMENVMIALPDGHGGTVAMTHH
jgi:FtsP/CotA-like multicopper oxidase with cupredoxin domain